MSKSTESKVVAEVPPVVEDEVKVAAEPQEGAATADGTSESEPQSVQAAESQENVTPPAEDAPPDEPNAEDGAQAADSRPITYLIASTPCTGALWLCETLARNELGIPDLARAALFVGYGDSVTSDWPRSLDAFLEGNANEDGVRGAKTDIAYLEHLAQQIGDLDFKADIFSRFTHFIFLKREAVTAQAVAWSLARVTGQWRKGDENNGPGAAYDPAAITGLIQQINLENERWQWIFDSLDVEPLVLEYGDLIGKGGMGRAVRAIADFLGVAAPKKLDVGDNIEIADSVLISEYADRYTNAD